MARIGWEPGLDLERLLAGLRCIRWQDLSKPQGEASLEAHQVYFSAPKISVHSYSGGDDYENVAPVNSIRKFQHHTKITYYLRYGLLLGQPHLVVISGGRIIRARRGFILLTGDRQRLKVIDPTLRMEQLLYPAMLSNPHPDGFSGTVLSWHPESADTIGLHPSPWQD